MAGAGERCLVSLQASYLAGLADSRSGSLLDERPVSNLVEIAARPAQAPELARAELRLNFASGYGGVVVGAHGLLLRHGVFGILSQLRWQ